MNNATISKPSVAGVPGTTASGIASASQLVELTPATTLRVDMTAAPHRLVVFVPSRAYRENAAVPTVTPLAAEDYPILAAIWDNEEDDIFDTV